ncbi:hypothetical protein F2Q69_00047035 [Brassica cretica]|uniref:Uncharacterized protein n=1 Tax=Brassica cretica TaxID=69181 RepID=A0A8S9PZ36_BRACR|nr:hypothetical protein F2Q69_00047035 [Brassica cretica]
MGSSYRNKSNHLADIKGKGILYEDDDEPIKLTNQDNAQNIKEFWLSLISKILNPKKKNVEKLLQKMPSQWGMDDRIIWAMGNFFSTSPQKMISICSSIGSFSLQLLHVCLGPMGTYCP